MQQLAYDLMNFFVEGVTFCQSRLEQFWVRKWALTVSSAYIQLAIGLKDDV